MIKSQVNYLFSERICMHADEIREFPHKLPQGRVEIRDYPRKPSGSGRIEAGQHQYQHMRRARLQRHPDGDLQSNRMINMKFDRQLERQTSSINLIGA